MVVIPCPDVQKDIKAMVKSRLYGEKHSVSDPTWGTTRRNYIACMNEFYIRRFESVLSAHYPFQRKSKGFSQENKGENETTQDSTSRPH